MKRLSIALWILLLCAAVHAQRITTSFQGTPLPLVLEQLSILQDEYTICAINNELEQFIITDDIVDATVPDALRQITAHYPIRISVDGNIIHVEAFRKRLIQYHGTVVGTDSIPLAQAAVTLYHAADTTLVGQGVCSNAGTFVVPCLEPDVLMRITHVSHDTLWMRPTQSDLGTVMLSQHNTHLDNVRVVAPPWNGRNVKLSFQFVDALTSMDLNIDTQKKISLYADGDNIHEYDCVVMQYGDGISMKTNYMFQIPARPGDYILEVQYEGYEPLMMPYHVGKTGRRSEIKNDPVRLNKLVQKPTPQYVEDPDGDILGEDGTRLREVVFTATKVQMYYRGDTLIYNADAFTLPDGSMLDDLLKAMPGVEVNAQGEIRVNGRKVDVLQLDGKDLMSGGTEMLLKNLPHYTVDQVKAYEQDLLEARLVGAHSTEKEYALNVTLKKQYKIGWLGNVELAGGMPTGKHEDARYQARAFVTRFSEQSRLMVSGMSNNVNNDASNRSESWNDNVRPTGLQRRHYLSLMYNLYDRRQRYEENVFLQTRWNRAQSETRQSSLTYLTQGDTYARLHQTTENNDFSGKLENSFILKKPFALTLRTNLDYNHRESYGLSRSAQLMSDPSPYGDVVAVIDTLMRNPFQSRVSRITLNKSRSESRQNGTEWNFYQSAQYSKEFGSGDYLSINPAYTRRQQTGVEHNGYQLDYIQGQGANDYRRRYNLSPSHENRFDTYTKYKLNVNSELSLTVGADVIWDKTHQEHERYRLDQLDGWSPDQVLGALPSTRQHLLQVLDRHNSYVEDHTEVTNKYYVDLHYHSNRNNRNNVFYMRLPMTIQRDREGYQRGSLDTCFTRNAILPAGSVNYINRLRRKSASEQNINHINFVQYYLNSSLPDMQNYLDVRDTYNPLAITLGNPHLRRSMDHTMMASYEYNRYQRLYSDGFYEKIGAQFHIQQDALATGYSYDAQTGVYTYQPTNIDGNWDASCNISHRHAPFKNFGYEIAGEYTFRHSVDLIGGERSTVLSQTVTPSLQLMLKPQGKKYQVQLENKWFWTRYDSQRQGFTTRSTLRHQYVLSGQCQLPWDLQLSSDLGLYVRSGYDAPSMNTADWVWNASLSRQFWKNKLLVKVTGYDILQQINSITQDYNSQGRTETWVRSIPSYIMASVTYKFHVAPKTKTR